MVYQQDSAERQHPDLRLVETRWPLSGMSAANFASLPNRRSDLWLRLFAAVLRRIAIGVRKLTGRQTIRQHRHFASDPQHQMGRHSELRVSYAVGRDAVDLEPDGLRQESLAREDDCVRVADWVWCFGRLPVCPSSDMESG